MLFCLSIYAEVTIKNVCKPYKRLFDFTAFYFLAPTAIFHSSSLTNSQTRQANYREEFEVFKFILKGVQDDFLIINKSTKKIWLLCTNSLPDKILIQHKSVAETVGSITIWGHLSCLNIGQTKSHHLLGLKGLNFLLIQFTDWVFIQTRWQTRAITVK